MEAVKVWARSIFMLSVLSSTVLLIVPKSMQKQSRFVVEMLLLLCVIAPLSGLLGSGAQDALASTGLPSQSAEATSLGRFYAEETARRVSELGEKAGLSIAEVAVATKNAGFSLAEVIVRLGANPSDEQMDAFTKSVSAYLGINQDRLRVVIAK